MLSCSVVLSFLILFCSIGDMRAQDSRLPANHQVFDSLRSSTGKVREQIHQIQFPKEQRLQADKLLDEITANIENLSDTARGRPSATIPKEYLESLKLDSELLITTLCRIVSESNTPEATINALTEVVEDLKAKVTFSQKLMGAGLRLVEFVVHTKKNGVELGEYEVWYVPRGWSDTPDKFRTSDLPSSPAIMKLAPGNYLVWLKKGDMITAKTTYTLGKDGSRKVIVFPIP